GPASATSAATPSTPATPWWQVVPTTRTCTSNVCGGTSRRRLRRNAPNWVRSASETRRGSGDVTRDEPLEALLVERFGRPPRRKKRLDDDNDIATARRRRDLAEATKEERKTA